MRSRLDSLTPYNAFVTGFNDNGLVVLTTSSGVTQLARQTGNGELKAGQPVVWQTSGVPGVSDVCFDPAATPIVKPPVREIEPEEPTVETSKIWILYIYNDDLYVGGHQKTPELVQKSTTVLSFGGGATQIWGDGDGWEATYGVSTPVRSIATSVAKRKSKLVNADLFTTTTPYGVPFYINGALPSNLLGRGLLQRFDITSGTNSSTWKNRIVDYKGSSVVGNGSASFLSTRVTKPGSGRGETETETNRTVESYPAPYSGKGVDFSYSKVLDSVFFPYSFTFNETRSADDFTILRRDRKRTLIRRDNWQTAQTGSGTATTGGYSIVALSGVTTYSILVDSIPGSDRELFSIPKLDLTNGPGAGPGLFGTWHTFNYPVTTNLGPNANMSIAKQHFGIKRKYSVNVHSIFKESSSIRGTASGVVQVDAWGIPDTATVLYTASWVANASRFTTR